LAALPEGETKAVMKSLNLTGASDNAFYINSVRGSADVVAPFTFFGALTDIGGDSLKNTVSNKIIEEILPPEYKELVNGELTAEDVLVIKDRIMSELDYILGPIGDVLDVLDAVTPEMLNEMEESAAEYLDGYIGDWIMEELEEYEAPATSEFCEII